MVRAIHKLFSLTHSPRIRALPKPYIDYLEKSREPKQRVHDDPPQTTYLDYKQDHETGYVYRVPDHPIHVTYPPNSEYGLWGGIGMVEGFEKPKRMKPKIARVWSPFLERHTYFSDVLDTYINVVVTGRTQELIDEHKGFDFYILKTPVQDLGSELGRRLQRKMLLALQNPVSEYVREKYKDFVKEKHVTEWHGLSQFEALSKFRLMRVEESIDPPLKVTYAKQLIEELKHQSVEEKNQQQLGG